MAVLSKLTGIALPYNCYEVGHAWHPDCNTAALGLGGSAFFEGMKIYLPMYVITQIVKGKFTPSACVNTLTNIFMSSAFLGFHGLGVTFFSCLLRKYLGKHYFLTFFYIPSFITSFLALWIERDNRRLPLALYVAYVATETAIRMAVSRRMVKPVPNAEVYLFSTLMAIFLFFVKKYGYSDDIVCGILKFIYGNMEAKPVVETEDKKNISQSRKHFLLEKAVSCGTQCSEYVKTLLLQKRLSTIKHSSCIHDFNCLYYSLQGFLRPFLIGYLVLTASRCFSLSKKLVSNPSLLFTLMTEKRNMSLGLFLGGFGATFRMVNCLLRWLFGKDQAAYAIPAAFVGGLFMKLFPSSSISLYLMWKMLEKAYLFGIEKGAFPRICGFVPLLYAASTALLFHVGVMEVHNLKPAYLRFLSNVSQKKFEQANHHALDVFGTQSSKLYRDSYPDLDYRYTSHSLQENALLWLIH